MLCSPLDREEAPCPPQDLSMHHPGPAYRAGNDPLCVNAFNRIDRSLT